MNFVPVADEAARRWRASLPREWRRSSLAHGLALALVTLGVYTAAWLGYFFLPWLAARVACLFVVPMIIGGLFVIGHDADGAHGPGRGAQRCHRTGNEQRGRGDQDETEGGAPA